MANGAAPRRRRHRKRPEPMPGDRHGRLVVKCRAPDAAGGRSRWECECDCGATHVVREAFLLIRKVKSCGCLRDELTATRSVTHGRAGSREWRIWQGILHRCGDSDSARRHSSYPSYGAKGILVCDAWRSSFERFAEDTGPMPDGRWTIDRIDNSKGYEPGNCRWASVAEQNKNKSNNIHVTFRGRTMVLAEWAREIGMSYTGLQYRLRKMSVEEALTLPDQRGRKRGWRAA